MGAVIAPGDEKRVAVARVVCVWGGGIGLEDHKLHPGHFGKLIGLQRTYLASSTKRKFLSYLKHCLSLWFLNLINRNVSQSNANFKAFLWVKLKSINYLKGTKYIPTFVGILKRGLYLL
jgi:hypothetical protein